MVCRDCGDKTKNRYQSETPPPVSEAPQTGFKGHVDPYDALIATKKFSYEELKERNSLQNKMMEDQANRITEQMSDAMRQIYIDEMISVANCEKMTHQGITPDQAIVTLATILEKPQFSFVDDLYPGLREAVEVRYTEIQSKRLPCRKSL
jgi:hypothetical protein